jgi:phosphoglycerol transferase MdoB-like AlkP superfamily enzyme
LAGRAFVRDIVWRCVVSVVVLGVALALQHNPDARSRRALAARLGLVLALTAVSIYLVRSSLRASSPHLWNHARYLGWLLPPLLTLGWAVLLAGAETRALGARLHRRIAHPIPSVLALLVWAVVLVSATDLGVTWLGWATDAPWKQVTIAWNAWVTNAVILWCALLLLFALTRRFTLALAAVGVPYLAFGAATLAKLNFMQTAVQPLDLLSIPEFLPLFPRQFGLPVTILTILLVCAWIAGLVVALRRPATPIHGPRLTALGLTALLVLLAFPLAFVWSDTEPARALLRWSGAPDGQWKDQTKRSGLALSFLSEVPSALVRAPEGYSAQAVRSVVARYGGAGGVVSRGGVNLIVYLVESLMDPRDLGLTLTDDPLPTLHALQDTHSGGYAIVPGEFGGSANTEFELLTGMSSTFLPRGSLPFRQYLRWPVPSLPRLLQCRGYTTTAVQPDPRFYYDRERAYGLLGFQAVVWLDDVPGIARDPRVGWPTDSTVVDAVLAASAGPKPFFVFAFPSSTHSYYRSGYYRQSALGVRASLPAEAAEEVKEYLNAARHADRELARMIEVFRSRPDSTIIVVLGDHLPPLSADALRGFYRSLANASPAQRAARLRRTPLLVWSNFPLPRDSMVLGINTLDSYILSLMGVRGPVMMGLTDSLRRHLPVITPRFLIDDQGNEWERDKAPQPARMLLDDYRMLQYDLLMGGRYSLPGPTTPDTASRPPC